MPIKVDMEGVSAGGFKPIDEGVYDGEVVVCTYNAASKSSGKPTLEFEFKVDEHPTRKFWRTYSLQPKALWALKELLLALGQDVPDGELEIEPADYVGVRCRVQIGIKEHWQGEIDPETNKVKLENEVVKILPVGDAGSDPDMSWS